jgi:transcriptional regulatory protein GAL4
MSEVPPETSFPTPYSAIIPQSKLAVIGNRMHTVLMSNKLSNIEIQSNIVTVGQQIDEWKMSLPDYFVSENVPNFFRAPRAVLLWKEQNLRILLWQAIERNETIWPNREDSRFQCGTVALKAIYDITSFCRESADLVHPGVAWYAIYFLFQATMVLVLYELQHAQTLPQGAEQYASTWTQGIAEAREYFLQLEKTSNAATRCLAVLDRVQSVGAFHSPATHTMEMHDHSALPNGTYGTERGLPLLPVTSLHDEASPETAIISSDGWATAADPSLSLFLGNYANQDFFQDFNGFPGTVEKDFFDYINFNMYNI